MAAAKRVSAFNKALREAQRSQPESVETGPAQEPPTEFEEATAAPLATQAQPRQIRQEAAPEKPEETTASAPNKGGRPRNLVAKKKATYYLEADADEKITAIKKALVRHADILLDDKGDVVDQALTVMRFGLEDEECREAFLEVYRRALGVG